MAKCKHGWTPEGAICRDCREADLRQQLQQAQAELNDAQAWLYDAEMRNQHIYSCMDNLEGKYKQAQATIAALQKKHSEQETLVAIIKKAGNDAIDSGLDSFAKLEQQEATIAAMRLALEEYFRWRNACRTSATHNELIIHIEKVDRLSSKALSTTTAGAELLAKSEQLERENKALRCCGNCDRNICRRETYRECVDNDLSHWQIARRLVSKGE